MFLVCSCDATFDDWPNSLFAVCRQNTDFLGIFLPFLSNQHPTYSGSSEYPYAIKWPFDPGLHVPKSVTRANEWGHCRHSEIPIKPALPRLFPSKKSHPEALTRTGSCVHKKATRFRDPVVIPAHRFTLRALVLYFLRQGLSATELIPRSRITPAGSRRLYLCVSDISSIVCAISWYSHTANMDSSN